MEKNLKSILFGLVIVVVGIILLGNNINWWDINIFFAGWWTLFIIVPSLVGLFNKNTIISSLIGLIIGTLLLLGAQDILDWDMVGKIFVPAIIIIIGLSIAFKPNFNKVIKKQEGLPEYIAVFSGCEEKIADEFKGGTCTSVFGGVELDLREAEIKEDIKIDCVSVFGGIDLIIPNNVNVKTSGVPLFGGCENKATKKIVEKNPTIYINYVCVFGGVDVK